ncbi:retrotransposon protein, putative, ty1-copia subclass [Tanacetum coccineum]
MLHDVKFTGLKRFAMKDLGEAAYILGIKIYRDRSRRLIGLSQNAYIDKILKRFKMDTSKRGTIPMQPNVDLRKSQVHTTPARGRSHRIQVKGTRFAVKNTLKYLRNTKDMFLVYGRFVFMMNGGSVDWKSSKQSTTAMSSMEAEYTAAAEAAMESIWIHKFISGLGVVPNIDKPMDMYCDNTGAITIADEPGVQKGAKHFQRKYHFICEVIQEGDI